MADNPNKTQGAKAQTAGQSQTESETEAARRAALTQEERDAEDLANVEAELAAENAVKGQGVVHAEAAGSAAVRRAQIVARMKASAEAKRATEATEEVIIARGRSVYLSADQTQPFTGGQKIKVTPAEAASLRAAGHLVTADGALTEPVGPKVYQEAGLLQGHAPGQGQPAAKGAAKK